MLWTKKLLFSDRLVILPALLAGNPAFVFGSQARGVAYSSRFGFGGSAFRQ